MPGVALLAWYGANARELPWRRDAEPYRVWVSEVMLQQTRVEAVLPRYEAFLRALPDVHALAAVPEETLFKLWEGLGYYSRARALQKAARQIEALGAFPQTVEELRHLSGFGPYTAGAVASIAFGVRCAAVDGNVLRIHARMCMDVTPIPSPAASRAAEDWVLSLMPEDCRPGDFNQALMDLGASLCVPGAPRCGRCPWQGFCPAHKEGMEDTFPRRVPKAAKKEERFPVFLCLRGGKVLVRRRPDTGMLAGLWEFPHHEEGLSPKGEPLCRHRHIFTHRIWEMELFLSDGSAEGTFVDADGLRALPMASAFEPFRQAALRLLSDP